MSLLPVQSVLGLVDDLLDLVLSVVDLLLGLTRAPIRLAFGFQVLVAGNDTRGLLDVALDLIRLGTHRTPPFPRCAPQRWSVCHEPARALSPLDSGPSLA